MSRSEELSQEERALLLGRTPPFSALRPEDLPPLAQACRVQVLRKGEAAWKLGEQADHLAVVVAGRLKLCRGRGTREVILDVASPGEVLGEIAFSTGERYQSDVVCLRLARLLMIPSAALRGVLESSAKASLSLAMNLAAQNIRLLRAVEDLSSGSVEQRLARVLLRLAEQVGEPFPGGTLIPMRLRRADLAAIAATTVESASRKISEWRRRGWVVPQPAGYLLRDDHGLRGMVDAAWSSKPTS
ncbi:MAG: Crp/Fnr family transcriptional regulator [Myxococcota bacterium]|nr:Crp/Fnr family transcriptional regulator [Myxococcota bacterium]